MHAGRVTLEPNFRLTDLRKMDLQLVADKENKNRAQGGKDDAGWMKTFVRRPRKQMGDRAPKN